MTTDKQIEDEARRRWAVSKDPKRSIGSFVIEVVRENWAPSDPALLAARDYLRTLSSWSVAEDILVGRHDKNLILQGFIAGANWQKGQIND